MKKMRKIVLMFAVLFIAATADAGSVSDNWKKILDARTCGMITEAVDMGGGLFVGGRAKIKFTYLDKALLKTLERDRNVLESVQNGLAFYLSEKKSALMKGREVFMLTYHAIKRWDFKIEDMTINGYKLTEPDILNDPYYRTLGEILSYKERERLAERDEDMEDFVLHVAVPALPKAGKIKIAYKEDEVVWEKR